MCGLHVSISQLNATNLNESANGALLMPSKGSLYSGGSSCPSPPLTRPQAAEVIVEEGRQLWWSSYLGVDPGATLWVLTVHSCTLAQCQRAFCLPSLPLSYAAKLSDNFGVMEIFAFLLLRVFVLFF